MLLRLSGKLQTLTDSTRLGSGLKEAKLTQDRSDECGENSSCASSHLEYDGGGGGGIFLYDEPSRPPLSLSYEPGPCSVFTISIGFPLMYSTVQAGAP